MTATAPGPASFLVAAAFSCASACGGYDDLPLPIRETAGLRIESIARFTEGPGVVQIALDPPGDAAGPFVIVGHPAAQSLNARVLAWALGPCRGAAAPGDSAIRLCLTMQWAGDDALVLTTVVESRADARRFTLVGEEAP